MQPKTERRDRSQVELFYNHLTNLYPFAKEMFVAFQKHAFMDVDLGHNEIVLEKVCERLPSQVFNARTQIIAAVRAVVEHFILFFEGIQSYYSEPRMPIPRAVVAWPRQLDAHRT